MEGEPRWCKMTEDEEFEFRLRLEQEQAQTTQAPTEEGNFFKNAAQDVSDLGSGLKRIGKGIMDLPRDTVQTGREIMAGKPIGETPLAQDAKTVYRSAFTALPHIEYDDWKDPKSYRIMPGAIAQQYADIATSPLRMLPDKAVPDFVATPEQQKNLPNPFYEHPVNTALALAPTVKPLFRGARSIPAVDKGLNAAGESIRQNVTAPFARRAIGLTKQNLNKTETQLAEANRASLTAVDKGIVRNPLTNPFSSGADDMMKRAEALDTATGQKIGSFLKGQGEKYDWGQALQELESLKRRFPNDPNVSNQINNFKDTIRRTAIREGGEMPFELANSVKSYIQNKINWNTDKASAAVGQQSAGAVRKTIDTQLENIAKKGGNKPMFKEFKENKKLFGDLQTIQKGLLNKRSSDTGNMLVSLPSVGVGASAGIAFGGGIEGIIKGIASALGAEWVKRYGSAAAASMSNNVAKVLMSNPQKYSSLLESAKAGGATLPAIEQALQSDPDLSNIIQFPQKASDLGSKKLFSNKRK